MARKVKMTKDIVPEDFTLSLAVVDALPVLFFCGSMILIGLMFRSILFLAGALVCFWAGAAKVAWKIIVVTRKKNIWWLFLQMRMAMPAGFLMIIMSIILNRHALNFRAMAAGFVSFPSVLFFGAGIAGMIMMGVFGAVLDSSDLRSNWIEQLTNTAAQAAIFAGLLFLI